MGIENGGRAEWRGFEGTEQKTAGGEGENEKARKGREIKEVEKISGRGALFSRFLISVYGRLAEGLRAACFVHSVHGCLKRRRGAWDNGGVLPRYGPRRSCPAPGWRKAGRLFRRRRRHERGRPGVLWVVLSAGERRAVEWMRILRNHLPSLCQNTSPESSRGLTLKVFDSFLKARERIHRPALWGLSPGWAAARRAQCHEPQRAVVERRRICCLHVLYNWETNTSRTGGGMRTLA